MKTRAEEGWNVPETRTGLPGSAQARATPPSSSSRSSAPPTLGLPTLFSLFGRTGTPATPVVLSDSAMDVG